MITYNCEYFVGFSGLLKSRLCPLLHVGPMGLEILTNYCRGSHFFLNGRHGNQGGSLQWPNIQFCSHVSINTSADFGTFITKWKVVLIYWAMPPHYNGSKGLAVVFSRLSAVSASSYSGVNGIDFKQCLKGGIRTTGEAIIYYSSAMQHDALKEY